MPRLSDAVAQLARVAPRDFTRERDALARQLQQSGQASEAKQVKALRRAPVPVWVVNRLAREEPARVQQLIAAADRMRTAQLGRGVSGARLTEATTEYRKVLGELLERAAGLLAEAGMAAPHGTLLRAQTTLAVAAADPEWRGALRAGTLDRELAARGFDVFGGVMPRARQPRAAPTSPRREAATTAETARAEAEARAAREQAEIARRLTELRESARQATEAASAARAESARANATLREAQRRQREAERALRAAERTARGAGGGRRRRSGAARTSSGA